MIKNILILLFATLVLNASENDFEINLSEPPTIDGNISENEWDDSAIADILTSSGQYVNIKMKHDGENLYFLFFGGMMTNGFRFPEINIDVNNDKSEQWMDDDWWFHVSATDCENNGAPGVYDNCSLKKESWLAEENITQQSGPQDTIEVMIPFELIGLEKSKDTEIGLCLDVSNTQTIWEHFPSDANYQIPATWSNVSIKMEPVSVKKESYVLIITEKEGCIVIDNLNNGSEIIIFDNLGRKCESITSNSSKAVINKNNFKSGFYSLIIFEGNSRKIHNFVIVR